MQANLIVIADDHPLFRSALKLALSQLLPQARLAEADRFEALSQAVAANPDADLVLLDLQMPGAQGFSSLLWLRAEHPAIPVAIVSALEAPSVMRRAVDFGACGFIPKSADLAQMRAALCAILAGEVWLPPQAAEDAVMSAEEHALAQRVAELTPQQFRVLMLLSDGRLNKQIAFDLGVTEATVKAHITAILRKLGLYRRTQAALLAQQLKRADAPAMRFELPPAGAEPDPED